MFCEKILDAVLLGRKRFAGKTVVKTQTNKDKENKVQQSAVDSQTPQLKTLAGVSSFDLSDLQLPNVAQQHFSLFVTSLKLQIDVKAANIQNPGTLIFSFSFWDEMPS